MSINKKYIKGIMLISILFYLLLHLNTLISFPYIHSDEAWLSGFSRTVLNKGSFKTSEPFFDLYPRAIHGLRVVFVSLQAFFIELFGYSIFTMRSLSLCFSLASLLVIYKIFRQVGYKEIHSALGTAIIAMTPHFIMTSHVARQEPMILFGMLLAYYFATKAYSFKNLLLTTLIIGVCIGVHPNSFIIGLSIGGIYLYQVIQKKIGPRDLIHYVLLLGSWACLFILISYFLNPNFMADYLAFGDQLGVLNHSLNRFEGFYYYYYKLWHQIGGTYVLLNIRIDLIISGLALLIAGLTACFHRKDEHMHSLMNPLLMLISVNMGLLIIGRYNQTAIIFSLLWGWILFISLLHFYCVHINRKYLIKWILIALIVLQSLQLYKTVSPLNHQDYDTLGQSINAIIPDDAVILGNLNLDYHFELYQLYDIRNLAYLDHHDLSIADYIKKNHIDYIILYDEMTYIKEANHKWDILYGDLTYYDALISYLEVHGTLVETLDAPSYGMRIAKYVDVYPWEIKIYKLDE